MAGQTGQPFHLTHTMSFSCITAAVKCQIGSHIKRASEATYTDTMYILLMVYCKPTFIWKTLFRDEPEINWFVATNFTKPYPNQCGDNNHITKICLQ